MEVEWPLGFCPEGFRGLNPITDDRKVSKACKAPKVPGLFLRSSQSNELFTGQCSPDLQ